MAMYDLHHDGPQTDGRVDGQAVGVWTMQIAFCMVCMVEVGFEGRWIGVGTVDGMGTTGCRDRTELVPV